jgi:16S rRNA processing protein RimM
VSSTPPDLIPFGILGRPHGLRGEMPLRPFNPQGMQSLARVPLPLPVRLGKGDRQQDIPLVALRPAGDALLVRLGGVESREAAAAWTNAEVSVPRDALPRLSRDEVYVADLVGCTVVDQAGQVRGTVRSTFWNGVQDVLTVEGEGGAELLVPVVAEFILEVDLAARRVVVDPHE